MLSTELITFLKCVLCSVLQGQNLQDRTVRLWGTKGIFNLYFLEIYTEIINSHISLLLLKYLFCPPKADPSG